MESFAATNTNLTDFMTMLSLFVLKSHTLNAIFVYKQTTQTKLLRQTQFSTSSRLCLTHSLRCV